ncbi:MAG TPA: hypothetical protein VF911_11600 [Thermoanaerobaculia bacterium]|jgi:hypothetical protein
MTPTDQLSRPAATGAQSGTQQEKEATRRFGCGLILLAGALYVVMFIGAQAHQAMFFTMEDYLRGPKATAAMPKSVGIALAVVTLIAGLTASLAPLLSAAGGVVLLFAGRFGARVTRASIILSSIPLVALCIHLVVLTSFYFASQRRLPAAAPEVLPVIVIGYAGSLSLLATMWWRARLRWPSSRAPKPPATSVDPVV